jgi:hypothetical protein
MEHTQDQLESLMARLVAAENRIAELESRRSPARRSNNFVRSPDALPGSAESESVAARQSRRSLLKMAGGAAAGAAAISVMGAAPVAATDDDSLLIGEPNSEEATTVLNWDGTPGGLAGGGPFDADALLVIDGSTSLASPTGNITSSGDALHAIGDDNAGTEDTPIESIGVLGSGVGAGLWGSSNDGFGVFGATNFNTTTDYGADVFAGGVGNFVQFALESPALTDGGPAGPPSYTSVGAPDSFELVRDQNGVLWSSDVTGAFHPINSVVPLPAPVRVIDTKTSLGVAGPNGIATGGGTAGGAPVHTSSVLSGINGIPSQALGLVGNLAIAVHGGGTLNGDGVIALFPAGAATPGTANINAGAGCFAISNAVTVAFGTGSDAGKIAFVWYGGGGVQTIDVYYDVTAYLI